LKLYEYNFLLGNNAINM